MHCRRDATFQEDRSQLRLGHATEVFLPVMALEYLDTLKKALGVSRTASYPQTPLDIASSTQSSSYPVRADAAGIAAAQAAVGWTAPLLSRTRSMCYTSSDEKQAEVPPFLGSKYNIERKGLCLYSLLKRDGFCGLPCYNHRHGIPASLRQQQPSPTSLLLCCFWKGGWGGEQGKRKPEP